MVIECGRCIVRRSRGKGTSGDSRCHMKESSRSRLRLSRAKKHWRSAKQDAQTPRQEMMQTKHKPGRLTQGRHCCGIISARVVPAGSEASDVRRVGRKSCRRWRLDTAELAQAPGRWVIAKKCAIGAECAAGLGSELSVASWSVMVGQREIGECDGGGGAGLEAPNGPVGWRSGPAS